MIHIDNEEMYYFYFSVSNAIINAKNIDLDISINLNKYGKKIEVSINFADTKPKKRRLFMFSFVNYEPLSNSILTVGKVMMILKTGNFNYEPGYRNENFRDI